jgi:hypothetical protein
MNFNKNQKIYEEGRMLPVFSLKFIRADTDPLSMLPAVHHGLHTVQLAMHCCSILTAKPVSESEKSGQQHHSTGFKSPTPE